jgi:hypothetical protein
MTWSTVLNSKARRVTARLFVDGATVFIRERSVTKLALVREDETWRDQPTRSALTGSAAEYNATLWRTLNSGREKQRLPA